MTAVSIESVVPQLEAPRPRRSGASPKVTLVQVLQSLQGGGLEIMAANLATGLRDRGYRPVIVALDGGGVLEARLRASEIEYHIVGDTHYRRPSSHLRIASLFRRLRPTAVHTHHLPALLNSVAAARATGVRSIVHTDHAYEYLVSAAALRAAVLWMSRATRVFAVVGERMVPFYRDTVGVSARRLRVIPNGIDVGRYAPPPDRDARRRALGLPSGFLLGSAGRLAPEKNFAMLLRAAARARAARPDLRLVLAGDGPEREALERLAGELGIGDIVHFLGWRTDLADVLGCLDLFALTSWTEGLPLVVLEAMACGVPVAATRVGDLPDVIDDARSGYLLAVDDDSALAAVAERLAGQPSERARLGDTARAEVRARYSQDAMVDAYLDAYGLPSSARRRADPRPA
jgi:glycosyltransferase involved in cell wall biosynthesis